MPLQISAQMVAQGIKPAQSTTSETPYHILDILTRVIFFFTASCKVFHSHDSANRPVARNYVAIVVVLLYVRVCNNVGISGRLFLPFWDNLEDH